jgi:hypothetical protein
VKPEYSLNKTSRTPRAAATPARSNPAPPRPAEADPSAAPPTSRASPEPLLGDPAAVDRWLEASRVHLLDLLAVAREGARRPRKRVLSRAEMRRQARDAFAQVTSLLDLAAEALRRPPPTAE